MPSPETYTLRDAGEGSGSVGLTIRPHHDVLLVDVGAGDLDAEQATVAIELYDGEVRALVFSAHSGEEEPQVIVLARIS